MEKNLTFGDILSNGLKIGLKNFFRLLGALILWLITIWIPYINVGTSIAICTMPALLSKGETINPLDIFNQKYRKCMGEFFLTYILLFLILMIGLIFLIVPGIVMAVSYTFCLLLVVDKGKGASEALKISNQITYGHKWKIFLTQLVVMLPFFAVYCIAIFTLTNYFLFIIAFLVYLLTIPVMMAASGYMYGILASDIKEE